MLDLTVRKELEEWKTKLSDDEKRALLYYTSDLYEDINEELRRGYIKNNKKIIELIELALMKYTLSKNIEVYRYEGEEEYTTKEIFEAYSIAIKETYLYENFLSTSLTIEGANNFLSYLKTENKYKAYKFISANLYKGVNCGFLDRELSHSYEECELLLNRGCFLEYKDVKIANDNTVKFWVEIYKI